MDRKFVLHSRFTNRCTTITGIKQLGMHITKPTLKLKSSDFTNTDKVDIL